jgi:transcriptional accessory protein Tex/SPT6
MKKIRSMVNSYKIDAISIGNGTASRETEFFIKIAFDKPIQILLFQKPELQCIQHLKLRVKSSQL